MGGIWEIAFCRAGELTLWGRLEAGGPRCPVLVAPEREY